LAKAATPLYALFAVCAAATTLVGLGRRLPAQNVVATCLLILGLSGVIEAIGIMTNVPFGPRIYTGNLAPKILNAFPWLVPVLWLVAMVNARGVARLIMRPWRKTTYYGFWVIGLTAGLLVFLDLNFEPFASLGRGWWFWQTPRTVLIWHTAPWVNFLGCFLTALAILGFTTPWLINKQPVKQPIDYHPVVMWALLNLLFMTDHALADRWLALGMGLAPTGLVLTFAVRGARW
jgi:uncharacterized membrane protein